MSERGPAPGGAVPPAFFELLAGPRWQVVEFISDLHLSEHTPGTFRAFEHHLLNTDAQAVLLLGDVFEAWVGDDAAESGFERRCAQLLTAAAQRLHCAFMAGNRDFLLGPGLLQRCGVQELPDPTVLVAFGTRTLLSHGDALCLGDVEYQRVRAVLRTPQWRAQFLAQPISVRREQVRRARAESEARKLGSGTQGYADADATLALQWLHDAAAPVLVHGHTHRPASGPLGPSTAHLRHVLSDWDLEDPDRPRAEVLRLTQQGFKRRPLGLHPDLRRQSGHPEGRPGPPP